MFHIGNGALFALLQVVMIDTMLAGDNAVVIGLAAAKVAPAQRRKVIMWGMVAAVGLRLALAFVTVSLLEIIGLTLAGGILLLWVCWKFYRQICESREEAEHPAPVVPQSDAEEKKHVRRAIVQIAAADVSMSLDNVLAVAGAAMNHVWVLAVGLLLSIAMMGVAAGAIAKLLQRWHWLSYVGLLIVLYVALSMIWRGSAEVWHAVT